MFYLENKYFKIFDGPPGESLGGVFKFFDYLYLDEDVKAFHELMLSHKDDPTTLVDDAAFLAYYKHYWRRGQMSDHYPIWIEMEIDSTDKFLQAKLESFVD